MPSPLRDGRVWRAALVPGSVTWFVHKSGAGILTCRPSATPFGLALGPDSPWADFPSPGNLRLSANGILTRFIVTRSGILTGTSSRGRCPSPFNLSCHALLPYGVSHTRRFGGVLSPVHYRRRTPRPVSYYALF